MDRNYKITVEITHITERQARKYVSLFGWMNRLGNWGCSRAAKIFYDGDGGARAIIKIDGQEIPLTDISDIEGVTFDFD